jgi:hypothetical protein
MEIKMDKCKYCNTYIPGQQCPGCGRKNEQTKLEEIKMNNETKKVKKLMINVIVEENGKLAKAVSHEGFADDISGILEIVGILEYIKQRELDKMNSIASAEYSDEGE